MRPDRRIGAKRQRPETLFRRLIERIAHAMQALMLDAGVTSHQPHRRQCVGVVGGELGMEMRRGRDQCPGADQIGQVGGRLGGENRIAGAARHLGALDLAVPIGTLDQPHHQAAAAFARQLFQCHDHARAAFLIGLHRQPQPAPRSQGRLARQPPSSFSDSTSRSASSASRQKLMSAAAASRASRSTRGYSSSPYPLFLHRLIAWRQGRQLDRNAVGIFRPGGNLADGGNGRGIGRFIARRNRPGCARPRPACRSCTAAFPSRPARWQLRWCGPARTVRP